jgi:hypothetical protein
MNRVLKLNTPDRTIVTSDNKVRYRGVAIVFSIGIWSYSEDLVHNTSRNDTYVQRLLDGETGSCMWNGPSQTTVKVSAENRAKLINLAGQGFERIYYIRVNRNSQLGRTLLRAEEITGSIGAYWKGIGKSRTSDHK